jgi:hypothetical protein
MSTPIAFRPSLPLLFDFHHARSFRSLVPFTCADVFQAALKAVKVSMIRSSTP